MTRPTVRISVLLAVGALLTGASSCTPKSFQPTAIPNLSCPNSVGKPLTLVVGARANSPRPDLPDDVKGLIQEAAKAGQPVQVIELDGVPTVALNGTFHSDGNNSAIRDRQLGNFIQGVVGFVQSMKPTHPQADVLVGLTAAGNDTENGGTIVLLDSGVPTTGPLSFTNPDMFNAQPSDVVAFLKTKHLMPQLSGMSVYLAGVGDTADPQPILDQNLHTKIVDFWTAVAKGAGACVGTIKTSSSRTSIATSVPVAVVNPPAPPAFTCGKTVLADGGTVGFQVGTATLRNRDAATALLRKLSDTMKSSPADRVTLIGTTSSEGATGFNQTLSEKRAQAIKALLVQLGVGAGRIEASGEGENGPNHINDRLPDGSLDPAAAAHNRSVIVQLYCQR